MIHAPCSIDVSVTHGAAAPRRLVLRLNADTGPAGYRLRGTIEIEGLDAWRIEAMEGALARTLGGRCTLMLGPADLDNLLDGHNVEVAARHIAHDYDLTPAELAAKAGLSLDLAESLLTEERKRYGPCTAAISALVVRLSDTPTPGEIIRRHRSGFGSPRGRATVAAQIGVSEDILRRWEDDEELVPFDLADAVRHTLGIPTGGLPSAPPPDLPLPPLKFDRAAFLQALDQRGLSQRDFCRRAGVSVSNLQAWLAGKWMPNPEHAQAIREILGIEVLMEHPAGQPAA